MKGLHDIYRDANIGNKKILASREKKVEFYNKNKEHVGGQVGSELTVQTINSVFYTALLPTGDQSYLLGFYWLTKVRFENSQVRVHPDKVGIKRN